MVCLGGFRSQLAHAGASGIPGSPCAPLGDLGSDRSGSAGRCGQDCGLLYKTVFQKMDKRCYGNVILTLTCGKIDRRVTGKKNFT